MCRMSGKRRRASLWEMQFYASFADNRERDDIHQTSRNLLWILNLLFFSTPEEKAAAYGVSYGSVYISHCSHAARSSAGTKATGPGSTTQTGDVNLNNL